MAKRKTPYGLERYRPQVFKNEFRYPQGTLPEAVILDLDETYFEYGNSVNPTVAAWVKKHYEAGHTIIVITARNHHHEYEYSFNQLMAHLPYPFFGPICRSVDDPRYAPEYKRETAEYLSGIFQIVGAADDSPYVNAMWRWWIEEYGPADFDLLEVPRITYSDWRKELPRKGTPLTALTTTPLGLTTTGKNRVAGTRDFAEPWWDHYATMGFTRAQPYDIDGEFFIEEMG